MPPAPSVTAVREQLSRILVSERFARAEQLSRFLTFAVEAAIGGRAGEIKESVLGVEVFGRGPGFDPRIDPIVRVTARKLRTKLEEYYSAEGASDPLVIELPKGSYVPAIRPSTEVVAPSIRRRYWLAAAACGLAIGGAVLVSSKQPVRQSNHPSVAVLPFVNMSVEAEGEYFSDGLTEELIDALCRIDGLRVAARTSVFQFKNKQHDIREIGKRLDVDSVVEGSVRRQGDRLRITAQLNRVADGYHVWSQSYDVVLSDALRTQTEISRSIASALRLRLDGAGVARAPVNPQAWQAYLRGRYFRGRMLPDAPDRILAGFREAIALDPQFAEAHAALARVYVSMNRQNRMPHREALALANASVTTALSLDGNLVDALVVVCQIKSEMEWDWSGAEQACTRAISLSPGSAAAHSMHGTALAGAGRMQEAIEEDRRAVELDPLSSEAITMLARHLYLARRYKEAVEQAERVLYLDSNKSEAYVVFGLVAVAQGKHAEAITQFRKMIDASGGRENPNMQAALGHAYAVSGNRVEAERILRWLDKRAQTKPTTSTLAARIYLGLGDYNRALELLEAAYDERDYWLSFLAHDPRTDPIRSNARFVNLLRKMNLAK